MSNFVFLPNKLLVSTTNNHQHHQTQGTPPAGLPVKSIDERNPWSWQSEAGDADDGCLVDCDNVWLFVSNQSVYRPVYMKSVTQINMVISPVEITIIKESNGSRVPLLECLY